MPSGGRLIREVEVLKAERNAASKAIGAAKGRGEDASAEIEAMRRVASRIKALDAELAGTETVLRDRLLQIPNIPDPRVPPGEEGEGPTVASWGVPRRDAVPPHWDLGATHGYAGSRRRDAAGRANAVAGHRARGADCGLGLPSPRRGRSPPQPRPLVQFMAGSARTRTRISGGASSPPRFAGFHDGDRTHPQVRG